MKGLIILRGIVSGIILKGLIILRGIVSGCSPPAGRPRCTGPTPPRPQPPASPALRGHTRPIITYIHMYTHIHITHTHIHTHVHIHIHNTQHMTHTHTQHTTHNTRTHTKKTWGTPVARRGDERAKCLAVESKAPHRPRCTPPRRASTRSSTCSGRRCCEKTVAAVNPSAVDRQCERY